MDICWLALLLLSIICICVCKIYLSVPKFGGGKMTITSEFITRRCPSCGILVVESCNICPNCGYNFNKGDSGIIYDFEPSSATNYTSSFTALADKFEKDPNIKKKKDDLIDGIITETTLASYVDWGYLQYEHNEFSLTGLGKDAFYKNRERIRKKKKRK
jgi:hypothetical protein